MAKTTFKGKDGLPVRLLNDRILVHIDSTDGERKSSGGIVIPATAQVSKRLIWARVVAAGPNVRNVNVNDRVMFEPDERYEVELQGQDYILLRERDIHAVATNDSGEESAGSYL